jgi:hypothetical protein
MSNGELLALARRWRTIALQCTADKQAIEEWAAQVKSQ